MKSELLLQDGSRLSGEGFGSRCSTAGEVVFNTGMVGYPETMTDPSYRGQILVLTYPLIGNYGVPGIDRLAPDPASAVSPIFESDRIQINGLIVSDLSGDYSHWTAHESLGSWMKKSGIPGISGIDTRALTKHLRTS